MAKKPTDAELEVLQILWTNGPSTVRFVNQELSKTREVVYTTTLKMMQVMADKKKGLLKRDTSRRTHLYEALYTEEEVQKTLLDKLLNTAFRGSSLKLVVRALGHQKTSKADLEEIKKILNKLEEDKQ